MFELPIHPKIVHLPLGLMMVLPFLLAILAVGIRKGWLQARVWWLGVFGLVVAGAGGLAAERSGGADEHRVETYVAKRFVEAHEDAAEVFMVSLAVTALIALIAGLIKPPRARMIGHAIATAAAFVAMAAALRTGSLGGALIYDHGAARAYVPSSAPPGPAPEEEPDARRMQPPGGSEGALARELP